MKLKMKKYTLIAAIDKRSRGIGFEKKLPWYIPGDLKFFKEITKNTSIIMGRKTWESLPVKYLKNRYNIVITKNPNNYSGNKYLIFVKSFDEALEKCSKDIFVIGGELIYAEAIQRRNCERLILTQVFPMKEIKYDSFFPEFQKDFENVKTGKSYAQPDLIWCTTYWESKSVNSTEEQYLQVMEDMIEGNLEENRTGVRSWSQFGLTFKFDLRNNILPLQTTKKMWLRGIFEEFKWMVSGSTNSLELANKGVKIWLNNTTREFLDNRGLTHYEVGDIGPTYGFNMRHYGAEYKGMKSDYTGKGVDQLENAIQILKTDPTSRRIVIDLWNPSVIDQTALPPCMFCYTFNYNQENNELNLHVNQRSSDFFIARNWNDVFASLLLIFVAKTVGMNPGSLVVTITNSHIYETHLSQVLTQIQRKAKPFPKLYIQDFENILDVEYKDLELKEYDPYPGIKSEMIV
jgi:dihydrofolate reductase / thymidylate synthase